MSECIGEGCTHPDCKRESPLSLSEVARQLSPEKAAPLNRAERRALAKTMRKL